MNNLEHKPEWKEEFDKELVAKGGCGDCNPEPENACVHKDPSIVKAFIETQVIKKLISDIEPNFQMSLEEFAWRERIKQQLRMRWLNEKD